MTHNSKNFDTKKGYITIVAEQKIVESVSIKPHLSTFRFDDGDNTYHTVLSPTVRVFIFYHNFLAMKVTLPLSRSDRSTDASTSLVARVCLASRASDAWNTALQCSLSHIASDRRDSQSSKRETRVVKKHKVSSRFSSTLSP